MHDRRQFLLGGLQVATSLPLLGLLERRLRAPGLDQGPALVVLQLTGGNDGLNTVVPHRQDSYYRSRPTLALPRADLVALDDDHGLHPALRPLESSWERGELAVVHSVGYPQPDRSHFRSMDIWHTADPVGPAGDTGWMGRMADQLSADEPSALCALHVGGGDLPLALAGHDYFAPSVRDARGFRLRELPAPYERQRDALLRASGATGDLAYLGEAARTTYAAAERMSELTRRDSGAAYPDSELARNLRLVAQLVVGGFGARVFHVALEGFDTHSSQARTHQALLEELGGALSAFQRDLRAQGSDGRVLTLVFSEFGRRVQENGSRGTDHGAGAPALLLGAGVQGGMHGTPPDLRRLEEGDVPYSTDFRALYGAIERDWMGTSSTHEVAPLSGLLG